MAVSFEVRLIGCLKDQRPFQTNYTYIEYRIYLTLDQNASTQRSKNPAGIIL